MQVLNLLLYNLRREPPDYQLLEFLRTDEHLVDIGDDLVDYEVTSQLKEKRQGPPEESSGDSFRRAPLKADLLLQHMCRLTWPSPQPHAAQSARGPLIVADLKGDALLVQDDVLQNSFNIYRGYVHVYGRDASERLMRRIADLEARHARLLAALSPHQRGHFRQRHKAASSVPGAASFFAS